MINWRFVIFLELIFDLYLFQKSKGWRVRGTLAATHMNSDGATRNITSPCVQAQIEVIYFNLNMFLYNCEPQMYDSLLSGRDRSLIDCVIAHGTGTKVGDRVELGSINQVKHFDHYSMFR